MGAKESVFEMRFLAFLHT